MVNVFNDMGQSLRRYLLTRTRLKCFLIQFVAIIFIQKIIYYVFELN